MRYGVIPAAGTGAAARHVTARIRYRVQGQFRHRQRMRAARIQIVVAHFAGNQMLFLAAHRLPEFQQNRDVGKQIVSALVGARLRSAEIFESMAIDAFAQNITGQ